MKRKILYLLSAIIVLTIVICAAFATQAEEPVVEDEPEIIVLETIDFTYTEPTNLEEARETYEIALSRNVAAFNVYNSLKDLGYSDEHPAVAMILTVIEATENDCVYYEDTLNTFEKEAAWDKRASEYPIATRVWLYMKNELGYSDIVCAGIMGNLMAECGGCWTQDLDWDINYSGGFGMIQWLGGRKQQLISKYGNMPSVEEQIRFMNDELYGLNGVTKQVTDSQLNEIMNASSPEECAYAFASYYERCASQHRAPRRGYARTAYEYFVD